MINNPDINQEQEGAQEGNIPLNEASAGPGGRPSAERLKSYGKKSLSPLVELFHKYQGEFDPYFEAISKGLQGGYDSLSKSEGGADADKLVATWFKDAASSLSEARSKLSASSPKEIIDYLETSAKRHPGFSFSTSYLAGLFFGRLGRHVGRGKSQFDQSSSLTQ